jgi:transcriptional regulator with PAS, ATPase and Fis domain
MLELRVLLDSILVDQTTLSKPRITIGRSPDNDVVLQNQHVSRLHAVVTQVGDHFEVEDRSSNGLLVDGSRVSQTAVLPPRCRLEIYPFVIEYARRQEDRTVPISTREARAAARIHSSSSAGNRSADGGLMVGDSQSMRDVYRLIDHVADSPATVLIRGEHGTGKELVARAIHAASRRRDRPFIAVNCAAIPLDLIESELFGYEKGAFTGALAAKKGKVEEAAGGTLLLDEIGELSLPAQAKLLRFLQGKSFARLGSAHEVSVDARVLAATNKDLERAVQDETFRPDLYYRIKVVEIRLPPLRERPEDIPKLCTHVLRRLTQELRLSSEPVLTDEALRRLGQAQWPGNVRQMENVLYSAVLRSSPPHIIDEELVLADTPTWAGGMTDSAEAPLDAITKYHLLNVLRKAQWNTAKAAEVLKVSRGTIYYKIKKYGIELRDGSPKRGLQP